MKKKGKMHADVKRNALFNDLQVGDKKGLAYLNRRNSGQT